MKNMKSYQIATIIIFCIMLNFCGKIFAAWASLPIWLDAVGTILAAFYFGPHCAAIVGGTSNIMYASVTNATYIYFLINISIGLIAGFAIKKGMLKKSFSAFSLSMILAVVSAGLSFPINHLLFNGKTGNLWGDSVIGYLNEIHFNSNLCELIGEFYVDLLDKIVSVFLVFFFVKYFREKKIRKNAVAAFLVLSILTNVMIFGSSQATALAKESTEDDSIDYSSYIQSIYNGSNGIPGGEVNDIEQTMDGILWVGTYGGLYQYDGNKFTLMSNFHSVKNVTCLYSDEEGRLWIGTNDNGISICTANEITNILDKKGGLADDSVRSISKNTDGSYYIGTVGALCIVELCDGINVVNTISELKNVISISAYEEGFVSCVTADGDFALLKNNKIVSYISSKELEALYTCAYFDEKGYLLLGTVDGTVEKYTIDINNGEIKRVATYVCKDLKNINDIYYNSGNYMICSDTGIGYISESGNYYSIATGSFNSSIDNILVDYQGNFWFTSSRLGLLKLSPSIFEDVSAKAGFNEEVVNAVIKWKDNLYFGTDSGLQIFDNHSKKEIKNELTELLENIRIRCLMVDSENHLWIATYNLGAIEVIDKDNINIYDSSNGIISDRVRTVLQLSDGSIVLGTANGITILDKGKIVANIGTEQGLTNPVVLCMLEHNGDLYAGTDGGGINVIKDKKIVETIQKDNNLSSNIILRMIEDSNKAGVFVISGTGVDYINSKAKVRNISSFPFYNNFDARLTEDGNVWVSSSAGIYIVSEKALLNNAVHDYELLDSRKGLKQRFTANSWNYVDETGDFYLCGDSGVVSINMKQYDNQKSSYRFTLENIAIDGVWVSVDKEDTNIIARNVTKLEFFPKVVNYSSNDPYVGVWLEGFDKEPMICLQSELESVVYTNLSSGEYTFHMAIYDNNKKNILEEVTYSFVKEKEFYDNWWFVIYIFSIFGIILIYLVWLVVGSQINKSIQIQRKELENLKLKQTADAMVAANEAKDKFLALMSHDIRTPINAILGMNEMILRESKEQDIYEYASDVKGAGNTLLTLVNSILDFSKIEEGKMEIVPVEYESRVLINNLINGVKTRADEKNLEFKLDIDKNLPSFMFGDDVRVSQVISNLLTNAVKYTEKGFISLVIREYSRKDDNVTLFVEVKDSGIGIKAEDIDKLFESFKRLDEERNRNIEGTGLGMTIVSSLLDMMGSKLNVSSEYGIGTTFSFYIDQKIISSEPMGDFDHIPPNNIVRTDDYIYAPKARIMVVDDNDMNLKVIKSLLKINGITPDLVSSGREAINKAKENTYDIIFLDHMMPDMDGIETLNILKNEHILADSTKVIILTANAIIGAKEQYIKSGFDDYLSKPIVVKDLERKLLAYLPKEIIETRAKEAEVEEQTKESALNGSSAILHKHCPEIDIDTALQYCVNSWDFYMKVLAEYIKGNKVDKLNSLLEAKDYENYRITIHSVKSNSMSIGATELSLMAKELEHACSDGHYDYVNNNHEKIINKYQSLIERLKLFMDENQKENGGIGQ